MELKATDLRIGNLVYNDLNEIKKVCSLDKNGICTEVNENGWTICFKPKPIQLTEEWLLKFGFEKIGGTIYKEIEDIEIGKINNRFYIQMRTENRTLNIQYVHQLQNLYFALCGEELILNQ